MATITWPGSLPQSPAIGGWAPKQRSNKVVTPTDQGYQRQRQRFTGTVTDILVNMPPMTTAQKVAFETFYNITTGAGTLEFQWYDFGQSPKAAATFTFGVNEPDITQIDNAPGYWKVSFPLIMRS